MKKTILDHIAIIIFRKLQYTRLMAINMRQPKHFIIANITKRLMHFGNHKMISDSVDRLDVVEGDVVVEIGSGNGQSVTEILKKKPQKIYAIEISDTFLSDLRSNFNDNNIEIVEKDAKNLQGLIRNDSVDKILLINVVYFLNPIEDYLLELKRILKLGGTILITGKFGPASKMDQSVFANTDLDDLLGLGGLPGLGVPVPLAVPVSQSVSGKCK